MTSVSDNFNRADGGLGSNWTTVVGQNAPTIVSNVAESSSATNASAAFYSAAGFSNDQYSQIEVSLINTGNTDSGLGPILRTSSTEETHYIFLTRPSGGSETTAIYKRVAGSTTLLTSENLTAGAVGTIIRGQAVHNNLTLFRNGVVLLTASDGAIGAGKPGIYIDPGGAGPATSTALDNFNAADFVNLSFIDFPKPKIRDAVRAGWIA